MTTPAVQLPDDGPASLADSSYEVLSRSMCEGSDDEARTVSVASTDIRTPDELSSDDDDDFEDEDKNSNDGDNYFSQALPHLPDESAVDTRTNQYSNTPADSMMTSRADTQGGEAPYLELKELPASSDDSSVEVCGIIREFNGPSAMPEMLQSYGFPELRLSIRMALSRQVLPIRRSFRLLYVGKFDFWAITDVNNHIGAALHTTPSSSRFNIVQGSEFPGSSYSSRVQLERSGSELVVDHCPAPKVLADDSGACSVAITLNDGSEITFGPRGNLQPKAASLPDLIIFGHPTAESESVEAEGAFRFIRNRLISQGIPTLDIAVVRPYSAEAFTFKTHSLRLCVEGRLHPGAEFDTQKVLPIDLYTFLALDPAQLNRHLAYITDNSTMAARSDRADRTGRSWGLHGVLPNFVEAAFPYTHGETGGRPKSWLAVIVLITMAMAYFAQPLLLPVLPGNMSKANVQLEPPAATSTLTPASSLVTSTPSSAVASSQTPAISTSAVTRLPSEEKLSTSWLDLPSSRKTNNVGSFEIEPVNDREFALHRSEDWKRKGEIQVRLYRNSEEVPVRGFWSSHKTYTVCLEKEYTPDIFTGHVSILASKGRKTLFSQDIEVKLGSDKSAFASVLDNVGRLSQTIRRDLAITQASVKSLSREATKALQAGAFRVEESAMAALERTLYWRQHLSGSMQTVAEHLQEAKGKALRQLRVGSRFTHDWSKSLQDHLQHGASEVHQVVTTDAWELTRPWRTSPALLQARKRALQVRCKADRTFGRDDTSSCRLLKDNKYQ